MRFRRTLLSLGLVVGTCAAVVADEPVAPASPAAAGGASPDLTFRTWAPTPPMGWNSWDCFGTTVTEAQTREHADLMARDLAPYGWQYVVVDIQWYEPGAKGYDYAPGAALTLDAYGRLLPAPNKFPSAADGSGFKHLADYVHGLGLKFGIHLMRGIPRLAVERNLPVLGTPYHAADVANKQSICEWNPDMYGVDMSKPGAQAYYDSVFALIASWDVDFVKVDDMSRPYPEHEAEIEGVRLAIDHSGRPMVLSLSPGETPLDAGAHVQDHANMWRISDDFWDGWPQLLEQFGRLHNWERWAAPGAYPDADMLPLGILQLGRPTKFTREEQYTLMSLWSIARSPLMHGGDMRKMDAFTLSLLTNPEVIAVDQHSSGNHQLFRRDDGGVAWVADVPGSRDLYLAVFNTADRVALAPERAAFRSAVLTRQTAQPGVPVDVDLHGAVKLYLVIDGGNDGISWDHGLWVEPRLVMQDGSERRLTDIPWVHASAGYGDVSTAVAPSGKPMQVGGKPVAYGIAAHAVSQIEYDLPAGVARLRAVATLDDAAMREKRGATLRFNVFAVKADGQRPEAGVPVSVPLEALGFKGRVRVRDLWAREDVGDFDGAFAPVIPWHGGRLYRVWAVPAGE